MKGSRRVSRDRGIFARIGRRIRIAREKAGWSRRELAERLRVDPSMVNYVEDGRGGSLPMLYDFARALKLRRDDLFPEVR